jgi:hypothetical protein
VREDIEFDVPSSIGRIVAVLFLPKRVVLSGRFDSVFPYETSQEPFMRLLGTPAADKKQILFDGGHFLPRTNMVAESLKWLDQYFGRVALTR